MCVCVCDLYREKGERLRERERERERESCWMIEDLQELALADAGETIMKGVYEYETEECTEHKTDECS